MDDPITREVTVDAPPDVVWDALTDPGELAAWFGADAEVDLRRRRRGPVPVARRDASAAAS